jgi:hypothetical protein
MTTLWATFLLLSAPVVSQAEAGEWVDRAEQAATHLRSARDEYEIWPRIARVYRRRGDIDRAVASVARIGDERLRNVALGMLAVDAAQWGAFQQARSILARLSDRGVRDNFLFSIVSTAGLYHDFAAAERACQMVHGVGMQQELWDGLARDEALAGKYDLALSTSQRFFGVGFGSAQQRTQLSAFIEDCRRRGVRNEPKRITADLPEEVFSLGGLGWMPRSEDISVHEERTHQPSDPEQRTISSIILARWYQGRNDMARCRFSVATAAESLAGIGSDYERLSCCAELGETMLRAGWSAEARRLVDTVVTRDGVASALKGSDVRALPPKLVFVLIQVGKADDAFDVARRASGLFRADDTWWAAGIACALEGKTEEVRRRLPSLERDRDKAALAAGVALGLQELMDKACNKAHR